MSKKRTTGAEYSIPTKWIKHDVTSTVLAAAIRALNLPSVPAELVNGSIDPSCFYHPESFRRAYWAVEMFSKFPFPITGIDREAVARAAFLDGEKKCAQTNERLTDLFNRSDVPEGIRKVLLTARRHLERLFDGFTVDEIAQHARWGPGSSTSLPARFATPQNKWVLSSHMTLRVAPYLDAFVAWSGWLPTTSPTLVHGNCVTFVPKNAKTDRSIAIEPDWNSFFQLGLGGAIRSRLQRWGVLLPIAQKINQSLARSGSIDGFLATIDLKAASDTVAMALGEALLPEHVFSHVCNLRSPFGSLDDGKTWFPYEKISSMGNGSTFELETALFWAISKAAAGHAVVYGDDIIVPSTTVGWVVEVLDFCGLTTNEKKTHYDSPFRESCGGHYFRGVDVSPVYVRKPLVGVTRVEFLNNLREAIGEQTYPDLEEVWKAGSRDIPRLFRGPTDVPGTLHDSFDQALPKWDKQHQCFSGFRLIRKYVSENALSLGGLRCALFADVPGDANVKFSHQREPGVAIDKIAKWKSTAFGLHGRGGESTYAEPIKPHWKHKRDRGVPLVEASGCELAPVNYLPTPLVTAVAAQWFM